MVNYDLVDYKSADRTADRRGGTKGVQVVILSLESEIKERQTKRRREGVAPNSASGLAKSAWQMVVCVCV